MVINQIENLRECLNTMVIENDFGSKEVLELSRKLDTLILHYLEEVRPQKI